LRKYARMEITLLKAVACRRCARIFYICRSCWRGQAYCCDACRQTSQREAHRRAQKKYRQTLKGREAHRQAERRRRMHDPQKTVADASSTPALEHDKLPQDIPFIVPCCHFCGERGVVVAHFPRRGYGRRYSERSVSSHLVILEEHMVNKVPLVCHRIRKIEGSFAWISHRFLRSGFFASLTQHELLLYFFLVLAADRQGLSYYHYDKICSLLRFSVEDYIVARDQLIEKDLIAFNGAFFQVISLPRVPVVQPARLLQTRQAMAASDPATIGQIIRRQLSRDHES
jgi:hypothetical protein